MLGSFRDRIRTATYLRSRLGLRTLQVFWWAVLAYVVVSLAKSLSILFVVSGGFLELLERAYQLVVGSASFVADLIIVRLVLELGIEVLVRRATHRSSPPRPTGWMEIGRAFFLLSPVFTRFGLWLAWVASASIILLLAAHNLEFVIATVVNQSDTRAFVATWVTASAILHVLFPLLFLLVTRVLVEIGASILPLAASETPPARRIRVLLIGSGGREHALAWKIARSPHLERLYVAPGNPGIADNATLAAIDSNDHGAVSAFCHAERIGLVVVGPEAPLVAGLADALTAAGIAVFGPSAVAAQLEGSKGYTKALCAEAGIPTAAWSTFTEAVPAIAYIRAQGAPIVVKADGLAAGKGVTVAATVEEAIAAVAACFAGAHGAAGASVVIEEYLVGREASFFALSDGTTAIPFGTAEDHKRVGDGDTGPNTGGMGAFSPSPLIDAAMGERVMTEIIRPTVAAMTTRGTPFRGVLYAGLMLTANGPKLIEYNVRFGDPETQALMLRYEGDLLETLFAVAHGRLDRIAPSWSSDAALTVVLAAKGYPGGYAKGGTITGIDAADALPGVKVFHAGTASHDGRLVASGGRVLNVTARGAGVAEARKRAYEAVGRISWADGFFRSDIGTRALSPADRG